MPTLTLSDSRFDGTVAAEQWMSNGRLQLEHFSNPGADAWGDEGCNLGDAALEAFPKSRHWKATKGQNYFEARGNGTFVRQGADWEDDHWNAFLDGFETEAQRIAFDFGWKVPVAS